MRLQQRHLFILLILTSVAFIAISSYVWLFKTESATAQQTSFIFTAAGDHDNSTRTLASMDVVKNSGSAFYLALGDLSYSAGGEQQWCTDFKTRFNDVELIAGNHDVGESSGGNIDTYVQYCPFTFPSLTGTYGKQYYFDYPQTGSPLMRVILISPGLHGSMETIGSSYSVGGAGYLFTQQAIDSARASGIPWIVVGMHKNCISAGEKTCSVGTALMDLLLQKKVDLILQGHDHNYQRSHQLSCITTNSFNAGCIADEGNDGEYTKGSGSVIIINGEFARPLYAINTGDTEAGYFAKLDSTTFGITKYTVSATELTASYLRSDGGSFADTFRIASGAATTTPTPTGTPTTIIPFSATWKYLDTNTRPAGWETTSFSDTNWASGPAELGYGDGDEATVVSYGPNSSTKYITTYFRHTFAITNPAEYSNITMKLERDDGAVVYLNGTEIHRANLPTTAISHTTYATSAIEDTVDTVVVPPTLLREGTNVIAVEIHQATAGSSDISMRMEITATKSSIGQPCPIIPTNAPTITTSLSVTQAETFTIWTRLLAPDMTNNSYYLQIDNECAIVVGDNAQITPSSWTWINYKDGDTSKTITSSLTAGDHQIKIIGREQEINIDTVLFASDLACVPIDLGDNCNGTQITPTSIPTNTPPPTATPSPVPTETPTPTVSQTTISMLPVSDTYVASDRATTNYGSATAMQVDGSPTKITYMRFNLAPLAGRTIITAKLRMRVSDSSTSTQIIKRVADTTWSETGIIYSTRPALGSSIINFSNLKKNTWSEIDITAAVSEKVGQLMSVGIDSTGSDGLDFYSKEHTTYKPSLIIIYQ